MRAATGDRPSRSTVVGVLVGFAGLIVLVAAGGGVGGTVPVVGAFIVLAAATSWAIGSFLSNRIGLPPDPFVATEVVEPYPAEPVAAEPVADEAPAAEPVVVDELPASVANGKRGVRRLTDPELPICRCMAAGCRLGSPAGWRGSAR